MDTIVTPLKEIVLIFFSGFYQPSCSSFFLVSPREVTTSKPLGFVSEFLSSFHLASFDLNFIP